MASLPREWTILQDSREKRPLLFPGTLLLLDPSRLPSDPRGVMIQLQVETSSLETGDYCLKESPNSLVVERKASLLELQSNLCDPTRRKRFISELERIKSGFKGGCLVCEDPLTFSPVPGRMNNPGLVLDQLFQTLHPYPSIRLLFSKAATIPQRYALGEVVARMLIRAALTGEPPDDRSLLV